MDDRFINKILTKVKNKFTKNKGAYPKISEYAFSDEEIESINKENKQKILELKQNIFTKKESVSKSKTEEVLSKIEPTQEEQQPEDTEDESKQDITIEEPIEDQIPEEKEEPHSSFINLSPDHQKLVMDKWNEIKPSKIDKDIIDAKDLLNHNYTITYAEDATKFIEYIRKEYEVVICYLIGFNNEKQGIINKNIFSDKIEDEWKYLSSYIKMLEKIRKNK